MYVRMYVYMYFTSVCMYVCTYVLCTYIHTYTHVKYIRTDTRLYIHTHTYIHTYIHTHTHTYTHTVRILWTGDRPVAKTSDKTQHSQVADKHVPGGIRTRSSNNQAHADSCIRPDSPRPQLTFIYVQFIADHFPFITRLFPICIACEDEA